METVSFEPNVFYDECFYGDPERTILMPYPPPPPACDYPFHFVCRAETGF